MSRAAKAMLVGSVILCGVTVWGVYYLQRKELDVTVAVHVYAQYSEAGWPGHLPGDAAPRRGARMNFIPDRLGQVLSAKIH
jgi:hypothetical protein